VSWAEGSEAGGLPASVGAGAAHLGGHVRDLHLDSGSLHRLAVQPRKLLGGLCAEVHLRTPSPLQHLIVLRIDLGEQLRGFLLGALHLVQPLVQRL
jgi:hypothetical protein